MSFWRFMWFFRWVYPVAFVAGITIGVTCCSTTRDTLFPRISSLLEASKQLYEVQCVGDELYSERCADQRKLINEIGAEYNRLNEELGE